MRARISEKNIFPNFDLFSEYRKIEILLSETHVIGHLDRYGKRLSPYFSIEQFLNDYSFLDWNLRGTFISTEEMRIGLGIEKRRFSNKTINKDLVLDFIQYAVNCTCRVKSTIKSYSAYIEKDITDVLYGNMNALLTRLGASFSIDDDTPEVFVVYDDDLSSVVANSCPEIRVSLTEYQKIDNRGDLIRKSEILCTLFKRLEPIRKKFQGTEYAQLCDDTTFLFNKAGIRHSEGNSEIDKKFAKMPPDELEKWYDRTYQLFLSCMVISQYLDEKPDIALIKKV